MMIKHRLRGGYWYDMDKRGYNSKDTIRRERSGEGWTMVWRACSRCVDDWSNERHGSATKNDRGLLKIQGTLGTLSYATGI